MAHSFVSARTKSGSGNSFIDARMPQQPKNGSKKPEVRVRGRRVGSAARMRFMRGWTVACKRYGWSSSVGKIRRTESGIEARVSFVHRNADLELGKTLDDVRGIFGVPSMSYALDPKHSSRATLSLIERDLLLEREGALWPGIDASSLSLWDPIDFGIDQLGQPIRLSVVGHHALFAGETGAGKTAAQNMVIATAALDPTTRLFVLDANEMLWGWEAVAERYVIDDMKAAAEMLDFVLSEHERRNKVRRRHGLDKWSRELADETGEGPIVLAIDEAPEYLRNKACQDVLRRIAARARISAIHTNITMQSPNATIIDTTLRNNFGLRAVFRVADSSASKVALGTSAVDASTIEREHRGVCYLHRDGLVPTRMRTFYPTPEQVRELCSRALAPRPAP